MFATNPDFIPKNAAYATQQCLDVKYPTISQRPGNKINMLGNCNANPNHFWNHTSTGYHSHRREQQSLTISLWGNAMICPLDMLRYHPHYRQELFRHWATQRRQNKKYGCHWVSRRRRFDRQMKQRMIFGGRRTARPFFCWILYKRHSWRWHGMREATAPNRCN